MPDPPEPQTDAGALSTEDVASVENEFAAFIQSAEDEDEAEPTVALEPVDEGPDAFAVWLEGEAARDARLGPLAERAELVAEVMRRYAESQEPEARRGPEAEEEGSPA